MKVNQVKCWFLRRGETGVPGENLSVQSREPTNAFETRLKPFEMRLKLFVTQGV